MSLDTQVPGPDVQRPKPQAARQRLEDERRSRLAQLRALEQSASAEGTPEPVVAEQRETIAAVLEDIDAAFARVENGTYGLCVSCGRAIPEERLEILPYTSHCVPCRSKAG